MPEHFNDLHSGRNQPQTTFFAYLWLSFFTMATEIATVLIVPPKRPVETPSDKIVR